VAGKLLQRGIRSTGQFTTTDLYAQERQGVQAGQSGLSGLSGRSRRSSPASMRSRAARGSTQTETS